MMTVLSSADWLALLVHFLSLSLLAIGDAQLSGQRQGVVDR